jgi:hypothetical protein
MDFIHVGSHISPSEHQKDIECNLMKYKILNGGLRKILGNRR